MSFVSARAGDLPAILALLADDPVTQARDAWPAFDHPGYRTSFEAILADPNHDIIVGLAGEQVVACLQLSFLPGLSRGGAWRAQIEGVRVAQGYRGAGLGRALFEEAMARARTRGCKLMQLTSDKTRSEAFRFYESLGFQASHIGFKLKL